MHRRSANGRGVATAELSQTAEWVEVARRGDASAKERLYRAHAAAAMRVALGMCGGQQQDAEDLTQEAFITCLSRLDGLREPAAFGGFLLRTVKNLGINRWHAAHSRARAVERLTAQPVATGDDMDAFTAFAARQRATIVRAAIEALPAGPEKETAELYYLGGLDATEEVARRLKVPKSTVSTRLDRFRRSLRKALVVELARRSVRDADRHNPEEALR